MPTRPALISGRSATSPRQSTNAVNEVVGALSRKLAHNTSTESVSNSRRSSFSMENILHPNKKEKKRNDSKEREERKEKRNSGHFGKPTKTKDKSTPSSPRAVATKPGKFDLIVESPPLVFIGNASNSTGALFSGRLRFIVEDPSGSTKLNSFTMVLRATSTTYKPIGKECKQCTEKIDELKKWTFLSEPTTYVKTKDHQFPFSYLFPGHLPATTHAQLGSVTYSLFAQATTATGEKIEFVHPLKIQRAIPPGPDKSSIRIFPPTNLTGRVHLPPVIHPIGTFPVQMSLSGIVEKRTESQTRWRLRKMMWRIEEQCKVISTPCEKHSNKVSDGKAIQHTEVKPLGNNDIKSGWKTDFDTIGGEIYIEFEASMATKNGHKVTCDMASATGLEVKHSLTIELIVAEEFCPNKNPNLITPTGAARVLRMQFALNVTERAGMGISWDEEMPPMYEDVPPSPPRYGNAVKPHDDFGQVYATMEDYSGPTIVPHDLERLSTHNSDGLPYYREVEFRDDEANDGLPMRNRWHANDSNYEYAESSSRRRLAGIQLDDLEAETAEEAYRRRRQEENETTVEEDADYGEGVAGNAPVSTS